MGRKVRTKQIDIKEVAALNRPKASPWALLKTNFPDAHIGRCMPSCSQIVDMHSIHFATNMPLT